MSAAILKKRFESDLGGLLDWQSRPAPETVPTGIAEVDGAIGGLPRGSLTEIYGPASSGRTSLLISILAAATARQEACALVDAGDAFDPVSAEAAGVLLQRVLWIRCGHNAEHALKAVDLLIQGGGFGLVAMDLGDTPPAIARRISMVSWFRLRRAVEYTPTVLVTLARQSNAKTCASLMLECAREGVDWTGVGDCARPCSRLLRGMSIRVARRKPSAIGAAHVLLPLW
jgi:recombination protein RecA